MRVTQRMMTENAIQHMDGNLKKLQELEEKIGSGKAYHYASEDPKSATAALNLRTSLEANQAYIDSAHMTGEWMAATESALTHLNDLSIHVKNLALQGISETLSDDERAAIAREVNAVLEEAIQSGNSMHGENYIFAGFKTSTSPFVPIDSDSDGIYESVNYVGDAGVILRTLGPDQTTPQNTNGDTVISPLLAALINIRDALNANDTPATEAALGNLETSMEGLRLANAENGARLRQVNSLREHYEKTRLELKSLLSRHEDTNLTEAISILRYQETVYQTVLEVGHRAISTLSLFDILS